ncbi:unnamed protein product, partial [Adineta steineri]
LDWCSHDKDLLLRAYEVTGLALTEIERTSDVSHLIKDKNNSSIVKTTVHDFKIDCFAYDVAKDPVTVHIPVVRLFAALHVHIQKYTDTVTTFDNLCEKLKIQPCFVYEESLRIQVLCAQHEAGLWKRNGHSLSNQIYYYSNVKCRKEMYDRDILALQVGASLKPADTYLIQLLHKFNLLDWVRSPENGHSSDTESKIKAKVRIMEEFLHLLIIIVGERHEQGVGKVTREQKLTREVIHQLCISPMAHSELVRGLQDCGQLETGSGDLEAILKEVADFKRGTATKGNYELKADRLSEYNQFYYHYTKADQCKSEEYVIKRRKQNDDSNVTSLFIPCPPLFTDAFQPIVHILDSDIFLILLKACLYRSTDPKAQVCEVKLNSEALVLSAYVQNSRVLSKNRTRRIENWDVFDPTFMSNDLHWGVHVSSCGHAIHASCWTKYHNSITSQDHRRTLRMRGSANYDTERNEFLCPLCQTLSNTIIPVLPSLRSFARERKLAQMSFNEWLDGLEKALN